MRLKLVFIVRLFIDRMTQLLTVVALNLAKVVLPIKIASILVFSGFWSGFNSIILILIAVEELVCYV